MDILSCYVHDNEPPHFKNPTSSESTNISHSTEKVEDSLSTIHTVEDEEILSTFNLTDQYT